MYPRIYTYVVFACVGFLLCHAADACRYSVREVGFVDLDAAPYHVWLHIPADLDAATASAFRRAAQIQLLHAPVVIAEEDGTGSMATEMAAHAVPPGGMLLYSPEDRTRVVFPPEDPDPESGYRALFETLIGSAVRTSIVDALDTFCQVLVIEGPDPAANAVAQATAKSAIAEITANMDKMDKPVAETATLITVPYEHIQDESTLLWSLGLEADEIADPRIAVLFGRARRLGGVLSGDKVLMEELVRVMALAGTSCECGLERKWMQGPMLLMRWDRGLQQRVATHLGFDPESPVIKTEISQILAKGGSGEKIGENLNAMLAYTEHQADEGDLSGVTEVLVEDVPLGDGPIMASAQLEDEPGEPDELLPTAASVAPPLTVAPPVPDAHIADEDRPADGVRLRMVQVVAVIVSLNIVLLLFILFRTRRA